MDASYNEMDVNMFNQYMYKTDSDNLNAALGQHHQQLQQQQQYSGQPVVNQYQAPMNDHTFHTPSLGDEEFDIPVEFNPPTYQMHNDMASLMSDQQTTTYDQHQWHPQPTANSHSMMTNQTYLQPSTTDHSNFHQQMLMMQQPSSVHSAVQPASGIVSVPHQPQMSSAGGSNYVGQSSPQNAPINSNENGSASDESDDNALNDPNTAFQHPTDSFENETTKGTATKKAGKVAATKAAAKKKKRDPNEPQKPVSAYALFFRDTQSAIKGQNQNASFGEVSKIVASMWEVLAPDHKNVYKKKQETAKKDYLKALAAYRAGTLQTPEGTQTIQSPQNMTAPVITSPASTPQQSYQFPVNATQNTQQQQPQQTIVTQQQQSQQFANQQPVQQIFQQQSQMINANNPQPPVVNQQTSAIQNCIRNGCTNQAITSIDWEDEYCSNECCLSHCKDVFSNWVNQNNNQHTFSVVS